MKMRSRLAATIAAGMLVLGVAGVALASTDLNPGQVNIKLSDKTGTVDECSGVNLEDGQALLHFVLTQSADADGSLDVTLDNPSLTPHKDHADVSNGTGPYLLQWDVTVDGVTGDTVLKGATTSATGDNLNLSHVCFGGTVTTTSSSTTTTSSSTTTESTTTTGTFTSSQSGQTTTLPATSEFGGTSGPDNSWMLIAGLGMVLGSLFVLVPAGAKSRR